MRQKGDLNDFERGMVVGATLALFQKLLNYCYFHAQPSHLQRMKKIEKKRKYPVSSISVAKMLCSC